MFKTAKYLLGTLLLLIVLGPALGQAYTIEELPIQDGGRQKPFLTYAQEILRTLHGKSKLKVEPTPEAADSTSGALVSKAKIALKSLSTSGSSAEKKQAREAMKVVATWFLMPEQWDDSPFIVVDHHGLKESLGYEKTQKYYSFKQLTSHQRLNTLFADLASRQERNEKLDPYYQAVQRLQIQIQTYLNFRQGGTRVMPAEDSEKRNGTWLAFGELDDEKKALFQEIMGQYILSFVGPDADSKAQAQEKLEGALGSFTTAALQVPSSNYPEVDKMSIEVMYQKFHPFMWTWILYLSAAIFLALSGLFATKILTALGVVLGLAAFGLHSYGFALRVIITQRPPVSNMYETVIWVAWGVMLFAGIFYFFKRRKLIPIAGAIVATICMVIADRAPVILDPSLQPLEPVLRSNMWLIIHVMTITLSYAAFFLAMGVGDYGMYVWISDSKGRKKDIRELAQICYQLIQVGAVLLAAGTILGGVWADYSWGRFWGWDPKETWAFIALMGYIALLHAKLTGWVKEFGMLAGSIVAFSLVIMAWYGVNYVLGAGLHSYGFGAGGIEYVVSFVGVHLVLVGYAAVVVKSPFKSAS